MKLTQGSANSRKVKSRRGLLLLSGAPRIRCLILRPPFLQANCHCIPPPLPHSAGRPPRNHRRPNAHLTGEVAEILPPLTRDAKESQRHLPLRRKQQRVFTSRNKNRVVPQTQISSLIGI